MAPPLRSRPNGAGEQRPLSASLLVSRDAETLDRGRSSSSGFSRFDDETLDSHGKEVSKQWRYRTGVLYMAAMAMCSVVLIALGATLEELAQNCGEDALKLSSVYVARGVGSVGGAMSSSSTFRLVHGDHVLASTLALLCMVLLILPVISSAAALHFFFGCLGLATASIDTGVQIMTRKAHGSGAVRPAFALPLVSPRSFAVTQVCLLTKLPLLFCQGPWLGANTLAFGVAGAVVPLVSLLTSNRVPLIYLIFGAYALLNGVGLIVHRTPRRMGRPQPAPVSRTAHLDPNENGGMSAAFASLASGEFTVECFSACCAFLLIGGQVKN